MSMFLSKLDPQKFLLNMYYPWTQNQKVANPKSSISSSVVRPGLLFKVKAHKAQVRTKGRKK